jgi:hypothetical protein
VADAARVETTVVVIVVVVVVIVHADWTATCDYINFFYVRERVSLEFIDDVLRRCDQDEFGQLIEFRFVLHDRMIIIIIMHVYTQKTENPCLVPQISNRRYQSSNMHIPRLCGAFAQTLPLNAM